MLIQKQSWSKGNAIMLRFILKKYTDTNTTYSLVYRRVKLY